MKPKAEADNKGVDTLFSFISNYGKDSLDLAVQTFEELQPEHLQDFRAQPRIRRWPNDYPNNQLPFDTEKQRRWYWANHDGPYTRSGRMAQGLNQEIERGTNSVKVVASYPGASTKYVLGNILGEQVESFQQRFHVATGWQPAAPKLERHGQSYYDTFVTRHTEYVEKTFS